MPDLFAFTEHLTPAPFDDAFRKTYLGQAHVAGSGPEGVTCRECRYFFLAIKNGPADGSPGYYAKSNPANAKQLKPAKCNYAIPHKADRRFPHYAKACRLFEPAENPFPPVAPDDVEGEAE